MMLSETSAVTATALYKKSKNPAVGEFFDVDPAGLAPASLGTNASMFLHTPQARVHNAHGKQKEPLRKEALPVGTELCLWVKAYSR